MSSYYYNELPVTGMDEEVMIVLGVMLVFLGIVLLCCLVGWILSSVGLQKIAKRRGIANAWLVWLPVGREWVLGSVSDQYQHLVQGKITARRRILLILEVATILVCIAYVVASVVSTFITVNGDNVGLSLLLSAVPYLLFIGVYIATMVFYHICNFDLYRSCNPQNAVVFLVDRKSTRLNSSHAT